MYDVCPLCGGKIKKGKCRKCGYKPPEESDIAAPYDIDPNNDRFGTTEDKYIPFEELYPQHKADVKQEERQDNVPNIKVRPQKNPPAKQKQYTPPKKKNTRKTAVSKKDKIISFDLMIQIMLILTFSLFDYTIRLLFLSLVFVLQSIAKYNKKHKTADKYRMLILIAAFCISLCIQLVRHIM